MKRTCGLLSLLALAALPVFGQYPEDALRFATPFLGVGARAAGMGGAYTGIANDYSALFWNPAGLTQVRSIEFSVGMGALSYGNTSSFDPSSSITGDSLHTSTTSTSLNTLGFVIPLPARRGRAALALGYNRGGNFASALAFDGFNPLSSIVQASAPDSSFAPADLSSNFAYQLYLANVDTSTGHFISPITGQLAQLGSVLERGGLDNWSFGGAAEVAPNVSVGGKVTYVVGKYNYERSYAERDTRGTYGTSAYPFNVDEITLDEFVESEISGVYGKFGLLANTSGILRVGLTATTPTWLSVRETFGTRGSSLFDDGASFTYAQDGAGAYEVITPWVFGAGASIVVEDFLVLAGDAEWTDWTALRFEDAAPEVMALNQQIRSMFTSTFNWRLGAELDLAGFRMRAGFQMNPSPYKGDPPEFDRKSVTAGLGIPVGSTFMIDAAYAFGWWKSFRVNYTDPRDVAQPMVDESINTHNVVLTMSYRY
jgi:long-subunit fatty acid transport protein